jgi:phosphoserine aminotransferase
MPIFSIYIAGEVMRRSLDMHGTQKTGSQEGLSGKKAALIYTVLDSYPNIYQVCPDRAVRSRMNICFRVAGGHAAREKAFLEGAEKRGLMGLKGHRSVGGVRASNYNAVPLENVQKLVAYMEEYAKEG